MNILIAVAALILAAAVGLALWARSVDPDPTRFGRPDAMPAPGLHERMGGATVVLDADDVTGVFDRLARTVSETDRSELKTDAADHRAWIVRTRVFGFPDVVHLWTEGDRIALSGDLTIGKGDAGTNLRRIRAWLETAGLSVP